MVITSFLLPEMVGTFYVVCHISQAQYGIIIRTKFNFSHLFQCSKLAVYQSFDPSLLLLPSGLDPSVMGVVTLLLFEMYTNKTAIHIITYLSVHNID